MNKDDEKNRQLKKVPPNYLNKQRTVATGKI